jgi:hypothetical protein
MNSVDLQEVAEEIVEHMFLSGLTVKQSKEIVEQIVFEALNGNQSELRTSKIDYIKEAFDKAFYNCHTEERFTSYRRSKKVQENFHNISNEELGTKRLHESLIAQNRKNIKEGILSLVEKKVKDSSYLETNMKKRQENNEKARKDMEKMGTSMKNPHFEEVSQIRKDWASSYKSIYEKKLAAPDHDPVGQEDKDIDNDGDHDKTDKYLLNRRKVIGKAMGKKGKCENCDGKGCEKCKDMKEGYKEIDQAKKNRMFRRAGNLSRDAISTPIPPEKRQDAHKKSGKIIKQLNKLNSEGVQFSEKELKAFEEITKAWED